MVWWLPCLLECILIQSLIMEVLTTSECNQTRFEEVCSDRSIRERLKHIPNESTRVIRTITCSSRDWFQSPDGGPSSTNLSSKYPLDDNNIHLNFSCISGSDEGIYGCLSDRENRANQICIQVYGKAVFASCPHESKCTENETLILPTNGGNVSFNATVIHIDGGGCGYQQSLSFVKLIKINETSKRHSKILYICHFNDNAYCGPRDRDNVNMTKGHSGFEFVITLSNVTTDDIGTYEAIVERVHPGQGSSEKIYKTFHLEPMVTSISPPSLQFPTKTLVPLPPSPTTGADHSMTANTLPVVAIVLGVTLPIIGVTLVITGIIITLVSRVQSRKQAASNDASRNEDVNANTPFCPQGDHEHTRYDGGGTIILQYNYNGSGYQSEDNVIVTEAPGVVPMELPPPQFDTRSTIDEMELSNYINSNDFQC